MVTNECFGNVEKLKYFGKTVRRQNYIHNEVKGSEFYLGAWWSYTSCPPYVFMACSITLLFYL
jgi:hypothetical protein